MNETSTTKLRIYQGENYILPLLVGAGILMLYFVLYSFNSYGSIINNEIYNLLYGEYNNQYVANKELILVPLGVLVLITGLVFYSKGLKKLRLARKEKQDKKLLIFNIVLILVVLSSMLVIILDTVGFAYVTYIGSHPVFDNGSFVLPIYYSNLVLFPIVIILVGIQSNLLRKKKLYDYAKVKKQIVPNIMWCSLFVWLIFMIIYHVGGLTINYIVVLSGYTSSQLSTSLLAAGVYLELVIKIDNSIQIGILHEEQEEMK